MRIRAAMKESAAILYDVLDTPVSPELLPPENGKISQKTEDLVGPYELHDFFLYYVMRFGYAPSKIYRVACYAFGGVYDHGDNPEMADHVLPPLLCTAVQAFLSAGWPEGRKRGGLPAW